MELATVEIPRSEARESYLDYRRAAKTESDPTARAELQEMARAFRLAAQEDLALIALTPTITRGGTQVRTLVSKPWRDGKHVEERTHYLVPSLAVCRAEARFVFTLGVQRNGSVEFIDSLHRSDGYRRGRMTLTTGFSLDPSFNEGRSIERWDSGAWSAMVPIVPPKHRPDRGLGSCLVLWEADDWTWRKVPAPPGDPALLRHVGGDIYAVLATWDLTPLEKLVLTGRTLDEAVR